MNEYDEFPDLTDDREPELPDCDIPALPEFMEF